MERKQIALLGGGNSSEREIALKSAQQIAKALDKDKYEVFMVDVHSKEWTYTAPDGTKTQIDKNDFSLMIEDRKIIFRYALIIIHGTPGENGLLQGYLDMMGVSYSTCSHLSATITFDKISTKRTVAPYDIPLAKDIVITKGDRVDSDEIVSKLSLPLFVKPNASGSSFGVTRVVEKGEILKAVEDARKESSDVLIEECITGTELACGVLLTKKKEMAFPVTEIVPKGLYFDYEAKYTEGGSQEITPARISQDSTELVQSLALRAAKACRCSGLVRVDFILSSDGTPYMIEINSIPGLGEASIVPKQARVMGITLGELFDMLIEDTYPND